MRNLMRLSVIVGVLVLGVSGFEGRSSEAFSRHPRECFLSTDRKTISSCYNQNILNWIGHPNFWDMQKEIEALEELIFQLTYGKKRRDGDQQKHENVQKEKVPEKAKREETKNKTPVWDDMSCYTPPGKPFRGCGFYKIP